jgi:hypothetical protein
VLLEFLTEYPQPAIDLSSLVSVETINFL